MDEFNANIERSSTVGQTNPLLKLIVFLCVLLLAVLILQIVILLRTNKFVAGREVRLVSPPVCQIRPAVAPVQTHRPPYDNWPSQMDTALNNAQRIFDRMDSTFANAFLNMRRSDPFIHFDDGWDRLMISPAMDMREHDNNYVVLCYLPTISPSNVSVVLNDRMLTVSSSAREWDGRTAQTSSFETHVQIPGPVGDLQQAAASLSNGVLKIIIPKGPDAMLRGNQVLKLL